MPDWVFWLIGAAVLAAGEVATLGFFLGAVALAALLAAALAVLAPPVAVVIVAGLAWLLLGGRRREGEKYAGLRILR